MFSVLRKQFGRVSIRLTLWHALLFLAAALIVLGVTYFVMKQRLNQQEEDIITMRLNQYAAEYEHGGLDAVKTLAALRKGWEQKAFFVRIADADNRTIYLRDGEEWTEFSPERLTQHPPPRDEDRSWIRLHAPGGPTLLLGARWLPEGHLIEVGRPNGNIEDLLSGFRRAALVVLLIFLPVSFAGGAFLASRMLRPLHDLTAATEKIVATGDFDARVPERGNGDELDALVKLFNAMLDRIDGLIRGMRDSLDNVAHDLRTPITHIRQKAQSVLMKDGSLESAQDALADCVEETERVTTLLNTLMDIAETEAGLVRFERNPVEILGLTNSVMDSYREVAEEKSVRLVNDVPAGWEVSGDAGALRRVFMNLLDNGIKYSSNGGRVQVTAERRNGSFAIRFQDEGCGIIPEDLPRIWDRLYRGDKSRSERGLGLGLSFVHAIIHSHGGTAAIASQPGQGTEITLVLPAAESHVNSAA